MARLREAIPGMHGLWSGRPVRPRPLTTSRRFQRSAAVAPCGTSNTLKSPKVSAFALWWSLTLALGAVFLAGTALEWRHLIYDEGLTIQTNLFGTTYYSLVGLHAFHVTVGLLGMTTVLLFALLGYVRQEHAERVDVLALYWHFVDAVWVVVFTVVYVIGR